MRFRPAIVTDVGRSQGHINHCAGDQTDAAVRSRHLALKHRSNGVEHTPACDGKATQGILRHKGWRVEKVDLPNITPGQDVSILAPAEIEIE